MARILTTEEKEVRIQKRVNGIFTRECSDEEKAERLMNEIHWAGSDSNLVSSAIIKHVYTHKPENFVLICGLATKRPVAQSPCSGCGEPSKCTGCAGHGSCGGQGVKIESFHDAGL